MTSLRIAKLIGNEKLSLMSKMAAKFEISRCHFVAKFCKFPLGSRNFGLLIFHLLPPDYFARKFAQRPSNFGKVCIFPQMDEHLRNF